MSKTVIGVHIGHNASAALVEEGQLKFALQEERLTRTKNQGGTPRRALRQINSDFLAGCEPLQEIPVALAGKNLAACHWRRDEILGNYGKSSAGLVGGVKRLARKNSLVSNYINQIKASSLEEEIGTSFDPCPVRASGLDHHSCHSASAYFGWGNMEDEILVLTCDGAGDCLCATVNTAKGGKLQRVAQVSEEHSVGALFGKVTFLCGMVPMEHEYKLMGLAPYAENSAEARNIACLFNQLIEFDPKSPMRWRRKNGCPPMQLAAKYLEHLLRRKRFDHIAGGVQLFLENFLVQWVKACVRETGIHKVALSGGVFMNVKANQKILELPEVEEMFVFPSCGDETNAIGAAWLYHYMTFNEVPKPLENFYLGTESDENAADDALRTFPFRNRVKIREQSDVEMKVADLLHRGEIVARMKGRCEFGARALGNRSILANPSRPEAVRTINEMIKCRDFWMPFAPSVLAERSQDYFRKPKPMDAPYMIVTFDTREEKRARIPAVIHPHDATGRPQEVTERSNPDYYRLLKRFEELTGEGLVLNTSFNLHGEPIVGSPEDALRVFDLSGLQHLALGNFLISKS
ncbi:MAG TPA: carbamoyltransferase C-terminal domain-containing protein [Verrucomicrobiae bacterium]|nr:carbamoyltransferase C-terminal domain-containing protein [Verrucomicrobiae bacterium]